MNLKKFLPLIGIIILVFLITRFDGASIINIFLSLNPFFVIVSFFAILPVLFLENTEWQILLKRQKISVGFFYSMKNMFIGYFYGFITPGGFGAYIRALYLKHESDAPLPKCMSNIIMVNTIDYLSLLLFGAVGALFISGRYPYLFLTIFLVFLVILFLFLFFLQKQKSQRFFNKIIRSRVFQLLQERLDDPLESFYEDLPRFRDIVLPFCISLLGWLVSFSEFYLIARIFSIDVPYLSIIFLIAIANVVATLPISIYGLGTREVTLLTLFSIFPVVPASVISLSLFWFVITWLFPSIVGAFIALFDSKKIKLLQWKKSNK